MIIRLHSAKNPMGMDSRKNTDDIIDVTHVLLTIASSDQNIRNSMGERTSRHKRVCKLC